ncbi:MAG: preprotein translocase subunit YajC [Sphingomonadales bacterium]|jgi:preprotein translocase subunit YajC|nr:preprotein translocase subunit YajC [Sphingomonadales bacterium]
MFFTPAYAQAAGSASSGGSAALLANVVPLILIFVIFWFFLIRPQQKQMKTHRAKIEAVKKGDQVVTGGGLYGKVTKVEADAIEIEIAPGIKVKSVKSMLTDVLTATPAKPAND